MAQDSIKIKGVSFPPERMKEINEQAEKKGVTSVGFIRMIVYDYLDKQKGETDE